MRRVYLDSNVFISLIDREVGKGSRCLFVEAEQFLERVRESGSVLVLSDLFFKEIEDVKSIAKGFVLNYFEREQIKVLEVNKAGQSVKDFVAKGIHFTDALHVGLAIKAKCDCIVTFNVKDFEGARGMIEIFEPEEF